MIRMHYTTLNYLIDNLDQFKLPGPFHYSNIYNCSLNGNAIILDNTLYPTIEPGDWILPTNDPFVTYEYDKDLSWCKYFGIGKVSDHFIMGEIYLNNIPFHLTRKKKIKRHFSYHPNDPKFNIQRGKI